MRATRRSLLLAIPILWALGAPLAGCGTSTFSSDGDAASVADGGADVAPDSVIIVSAEDGSSADGDSAGADATTGVADASHDAVSSDHVAPPHDATADSMADAGQASGDANGASDASDGGAAADSGGDATQANSDAAAGNDASGGVDASTGVTVSGHAFAQGDYGGLIAFGKTPLAFREVGIRDATGKLTTTNTDAMGSFQLAGVTPPYDAVIYPGSPSDYPYVYLGLSTVHPRLIGAVTRNQYQATVNSSIQFQDCGSSTCECSATYWYPDIDSYSSIGCAINTNPVRGNISSTTAWSGPSTVTADLHVLEWDAQGQHFWHGVATGISFTGNLTTTIPPMVMASVPTAGTVTVNATTAGVPASWSQTTSLSINYANNDGFASLAFGPAPPLVMGVPDIAGATVSAAVQASDPAGTVFTGFLTFGGVSNLAPSTASVNVTLKPPPTVTSPPSNGSITQTGVIAWSSTSPQQVYQVILEPFVQGDAGPEPTGKVGALVYTSGGTVDLTRLSALGAPIAAGLTQLQLRAAGLVASLDVMLDEQTLAKADGTIGSWGAQLFTIAP